MLTDTHAHLDFPQFRADIPGVLARADAAGVRRIVTIGTGIESNARAIALAAEFPQVFAAIGVHPNNIAGESEDFITVLRECSRSPRVVAIGETGLDYHWLPGRRHKHPPIGDLADSALTTDSLAVDTEAVDRAAKAAQAAAFRAHLDLAVETGLPVIIHEREAWDDTLAILREYTGRVRAVLHCFGKSAAHAAEVISLGHLVSFTGIVTFKNAPDAQAAAIAVPPDAFMVETDCPYLAPVPHRGKTCEPAHARITAEFIATLRGIPFADLAAQTENNAGNFFRF